jgi:hypothetical protein
MLWSTFSSEKTSGKDDEVKAEDKFPECESCINRKFDPEMCEDCEDACNYEPGDDEEDFFEDDTEDMTIQEFKVFWNSKT